MGVAAGRMADRVRVLSDLSGAVVGALIDDADEGQGADPFTAALRRYRDEGAPDLTTPWRVPDAADGGERAVQVLRRLTRDLLERVTTPADVPPDASEDAPLPANVLRIEGPIREVPGLELASDGTWKPSASALAAREEADTDALRRSVTRARSRYPRVPRGDRSVPPPTPTRLT